MTIKTGQLDNPQVQNLLIAHRQNMFEHSPPESVHALDFSAFTTPNITLYTLWNRDELMGCGALSELTITHCEIKTMRTLQAHLRKGVAANILTHILRQAVERGYQRISLETGTMDAFLPAVTLYKKFGFVECEPFANYTQDPHSMCMTLNLQKTKTRL